MAEYLARVRRGEEFSSYGSLTARHPHDLVRAMRAITGDELWYNVRIPDEEREGGSVNMNEFISRNYQRMKAEAIAEGRAEGREEGLAAGRAEARDTLSTLLDRLEPLGRASELALAVRDPAYCEKLCEEFGIKAPEAA